MAVVRVRVEGVDRDGRGAGGTGVEPVVLGSAGVVAAGSDPVSGDGVAADSTAAGRAGGPEDAAAGRALLRRRLEGWRGEELVMAADGGERERGALRRSTVR
jgi:hypothetical protein